MIHCIHKFELDFILLKINKQMLRKFGQQLPPTFQLSKT